MDSPVGFSRIPRRAMLAGLASLGANLLAKRPLRAQSNLRAGPRRVDVHHHLYPPKYRIAVAAANAGNLPVWTPEQSVANMDKSGIQSAVLSLSPPGIAFGDVAQARDLARIVNDYGAKVKQDFPGRFGLFAALPLPDVEGSVREVEYALDTLKADGVGLLTSFGDRWLGDASFAPVWEELQRRKAVVYTHPNIPSCCQSLKDDVSPGTIELITDTARTIGSVLFSGTAARYPDIRWIFSHGGGATPLLLGRFAWEEAHTKEREKHLPRGVMYELKKFYYETAQANDPGILAALLNMVPVSQILFGTDSPYRTGGEVADGLAAHGFSASDLQAIEHGNALRIFPQLV